jgi:molecular chaperone GrpE
MGFPVTKARFSTAGGRVRHRPLISVVASPTGAHGFVCLPNHHPDAMSSNTSPADAAQAATPQPAQNPVSPEESLAAGAEADTLAALTNEVSDLRAKNADLAEQFLRAKADAQNTMRRAEEEMAKARKFAVESFAESMLPVADSLEAGLAVQEASAQQIREGAEATLKQLRSALERHKVIAIAPDVGARFDPAQHQAISLVPADQPTNTVVSVLQKGYLIADRVLRPALVTVAAPK